jgi:lipopolysaccharide biosynthesis regulator YciM
MAEVRQRKGEKSQASKTGEQISPSKEELDAVAKGREDNLVAHIEETIKKNAPDAVKGLSKEAKEIKNQLDEDPFNMELIFKLGVAYGSDCQWNKCMNVMLRGYKRVSEFENAGMRFEFLCLLAQASLKEEKYRQALAVIQDAQEPEDAEKVRAWEALRCQVYCHNGDAKRGLKSLSTAIEGKSFDEACALWANCVGPLKKAGAYDLSKSTVLAMAKDQEEGTQKMEAFEKLAELRDEYHKSVKAKVSPFSAKKYMIVAILMSVISAGLYWLYLLETSSLAKLKS